MQRLGFDGSIAIHCSDCGEYITRLPNYPGFSTVLCVQCQKKRETLKQELAKQQKGKPR